MAVQGDKGIDTEMSALDRQERWDEETWKGYEEQRNNRILRKNKVILMFSLILKKLMICQNTLLR